MVVTINEKEILNLPDDLELGKYVRDKYNHEKFVCDNSFDHCVLCGKQSPYTKMTRFDNRIGYIEGAGQSCFQPKICDKI